MTEKTDTAALLEEIVQSAVEEMQEIMNRQVAEFVRNTDAYGGEGKMVFELNLDKKGDPVKIELSMKSKFERKLTDSEAREIDIAQTTMAPIEQAAKKGGKSRKPKA